MEQPGGQQNQWGNQQNQWNQNQGATQQWGGQTNQSQWGGQPAATNQWAGQTSNQGATQQWGGQPAHGTQSQWGAQQANAQAQNAWYAQYYNQIQQAEMNKLRAWFASVDSDRSGSISHVELARLTFGGFPLGLDIAIKLVKVFDRDRSGTIEFYEY